MMYFIIGGDRQEYGPISAETIAQWIAEGRANRETQARGEHETAWRPLGAIPEFAPALGGTGTAVCAECLRAFPEGDMIRHGNYFVCANCKPVFLQKLAEGASINAPKAADTPTLEAVFARDYNVDVGRCFSSAWKVCTEKFWPVVGVTAAALIPYYLVTWAIGAGIQIACLMLLGIEGDYQPTPGQPPDFAALGAMITINIFGSMISSIIGMLFLSGFFFYCLKLVRGETATLEDAYAGFTLAPARILGTATLKGVLTSLGMLLCLLPGIFLGVCWAFAELLVLDRRLGPWEAMQASLKVVMKHWFLIFALLLLVVIVASAGSIACCVGALFTAPLATAAMAQAYQDIFGTPPERAQGGA